MFLLFHVELNVEILLYRIFPMKVTKQLAMKHRKQDIFLLHIYNIEIQNMKNLSFVTTRNGKLLVTFIKDKFIFKIYWFNGANYWFLCHF